jgi:hypothetical protein
MLSHTQQVLPVRGFLHTFLEFQESFIIDEAHPQRYFLDASDLQALPILDGLDEDRGVGERIMGPGIEPGESPAHQGQGQLTPPEVFTVVIGDLVPP